MTKMRCFLMKEQTFFSHIKLFFASNKIMSVTKIGFACQSDGGWKKDFDIVPDHNIYFVVV